LAKHFSNLRSKKSRTRRRRFTSKHENIQQPAFVRSSEHGCKRCCTLFNDHWYRKLSLEVFYKALSS